MHNAAQIERVPACTDEAFAKMNQRHPVHLDNSARRRKAEACTGVLHRSCPPNGDTVAFGHALIDAQMDMRKRVPELEHILLELFAIEDGLGLRETEGLGVRRSQLIDGFQSALVPDLFKPACRDSV